MSKKHLHRIIFSFFWLYFFAFRDILGPIRLLDYLIISLVPIGIIILISTERESSNIIKWVTLLMSPLFIATIVDSSPYIIFFVLKSYLVAVYFAMYFKVMKLTKFELTCFILPVFISVYYFFQPRPEDYIYLMKGRMTGISEPNFTSLSLIISFCGAFGIQMITKKNLVKLLMIIVIFISCWGVILTASRSGFIAVIVLILLLPVIKKVKWYFSLILIFVAILVGFNSDIIIDITNKFVVFERLEVLTSKYDSLTDAIAKERPFTERAWDTVLHEDWFIGGGSERVHEWSLYNRVVPHNSFLDIGIAFGRASFYFYSLLLMIWIFINISIILKNRDNKNQKDKSVLVSPMFFLTMLPMYMFLSAGMTLIFIFWMTLGAYPLLSKKFHSTYGK